MRRTWAVVGLLGAVVGSGTLARADTGYEDDDLSLRLASAFVRFTEVTAFGGETAANRWSPAVNPASADWTPLQSRHGAVVAGYWSHIEFDSGVNVELLGETGLWDTRTAGTFHPTFSQVWSNDGEDRQGVEFDYETNTFQLQWGKRFGRFAAGATVNLATSEVVRRVAGMEVASSEGETYRFRVGFLAEPKKCWLVGLVGEYGWTPFDYAALVPTPVGLMPVSGEDTQIQAIVRTGVSWEYRPYSVVYADFQYGFFENDRGDLEVWRWNAGVQHRLWQFLFLRAGASIDHEGNPGFVGGVGVAFSRWGSFDLAYQYAMLPELEPDFGKANTLQVTLSVRF